MRLDSHRIEFPGSQGILAARLDTPRGGARAYALFAHCFTCSKDIFAASRIAARLADNGIATLRFDFTGLGASEGEFANTNFSSNVDDLVAAADWLATRHGPAQLMVGHSLGVPRCWRRRSVSRAAGRSPPSARRTTRRM
ncbi:alpha/beta fold hydrolase [Hankyongella ginsenosidimutans]|uniref:alpha/beta fold hydrolase n=1 Tax=Hankyongella ginsenosidimutans TaxID=1763828 RepID=UPI001FE3A168|nr:alpha/beta fold hydrolase [Hankyongella ginsenosidimutans]